MEQYYRTSPEYVSPAKIFARTTARAIWMGAKQRAALDYLAGREPVRVMLGPASTGKSTLMQRLRGQSNDAVVLALAGPQESAGAVLGALLAAAELGPWILSEVEQRNLLTVFMQQRHLQGKRVLICIDNIAQMSDEAWDEIERLRLLKVGEKQIVEVALVGTESDAARAPVGALLRAAPKGNRAPHILSAPTDHDIESYIEWRLAQFDVRNAFSAEACALINSLAQRRFSFVNVLCQVVLMEQSRDPAETIDAAMVHRATATLPTFKDNAKIALERIEAAASARPSTGRVIVSCNGAIVRNADLRGRMLIGRSEDNDLFFPSRYLSRHHAVILPTEQGHYYIVDLNSANGVLVNGKRVSSSLLYNGDIVSLGQFRIKVELDEPLAEPTLPRSTNETDIMPGPSCEDAAVRIVKS
jgi:hypothetical protein